MLATRPDGILWLMSTPKAQSGFFYQAWADTGGPWTRLSVTAAEIPSRISSDFLEEQKRRDVNKFRREYCCEFIADEGSLFDRSGIDNLLTDQVQLL